MQNVIDEAIRLREEDCFDESIAILQTLISIPGYSGKAYLHIAWSFDAQGKEKEAIPNYKKALIKGQLSSAEKFDCLLGLASSLRCLGQYEEADGYFERTIQDFPEKIEIIPFYAMNLYNLGRSKESVSVLLRLLIQSTGSEDINAYQRAIEMYASDLDKTW